MLGQKTTTPARAGMLWFRNKIGLMLKKSAVVCFVSNWKLPFAESLNRLSVRMHERWTRVGASAQDCGHALGFSEVVRAGENNEVRAACGARF